MIYRQAPYGSSFKTYQVCFILKHFNTVTLDLDLSAVSMWSGKEFQIGAALTAKKLLFTLYVERCCTILRLFPLAA